MNPTPAEVWQATLYICGAVALAAATLAFCGFIIIALFLGVCWLASLFARGDKVSNPDGGTTELTADGLSRIYHFPGGQVGTVPLGDPAIPPIHVDSKTQ